ncbi:hypothetical protein [Wenyingzhuangia sp. 2_MG-2023]|uniref:hypothetical protein n=1 Tax=Wenyingzhuangia sp. 2_MG-2023 TaxID=3062639 RepID=UPI0026E18FFB|nr:hypothetical protein [Wenyingzhuangia sp. 2_MG-2023]MDO6739334.1 hypothetical protein [Wenyingzhuangia sp. 2_MG-2023]
MTYNISENRNLSDVEFNLLKYLFKKEKPEWINIINNLKVIGKCGCGECPTIMFGENYDSKILKNQKLLIDYVGKNKENNLIGIIIFGNKKTPTELEFYSIDSLTKEIKLSEIHSLEKNI